jgi:SAM-dependent methyltransferase
VQNPSIYTHEDVFRMLDALLADRASPWWDEFFSDRAKPIPAQALAWATARIGEIVNFQHCDVFDAQFEDGSYDLVYDSGCFHHLAPHRRQDYVSLVDRALKPGGRYGLVCFRPEGGSGYTDQQVYERASLGGGLGYSEDHLRWLWDRPPFRVRVLRQMRKPGQQERRFGEDFLWTLLAAKQAAGRTGA